MKKAKFIPIQIYDVFTDSPLEGNSAGVVLKADGLAPNQMQKIAREIRIRC